MKQFNNEWMKNIWLNIWVQFLLIGIWNICRAESIHLLLYKNLIIFVLKSFFWHFWFSNSFLHIETVQSLLKWPSNEWLFKFCKFLNNSDMKKCQIGRHAVYGLSQVVPIPPKANYKPILMCNSFWQMDDGFYLKKWENRLIFSKFKRARMCDKFNLATI
jgi:hypothetical protein